MATGKSSENLSRKKAEEMRDKILLLLKDEIKKSGKSKTAVAKAAGVASSTVGRIIKGERGDE